MGILDGFWRSTEQIRSYVDQTIAYQSNSMFPWKKHLKLSSIKKLRFWLLFRFDLQGLTIRMLIWIRRRIRVWNRAQYHAEQAIIRIRKRTIFRIITTRAAMIYATIVVDRTRLIRTAITKRNTRIWKISTLTMVALQFFHQSDAITGMLLLFFH